MIALKFGDKRLTAPLDDSDLRSPIPLPAETLRDRDAELVGELQTQHWLDEAYDDFVKNGGVDRLPGKGKPLQVPTGDVMETILKNANVPPPWIMLRHEIQSSLEQAVRLLRRKPEDQEIDALLRDINEKIVALNVTAPSLSLHRRKVTRENAVEQYQKWK